MDRKEQAKSFCNEIRKTSGEVIVCYGLQGRLHLVTNIPSETNLTHPVRLLSILYFLYLNILTGRAVLKYKTHLVRNSSLGSQAYKGKCNHHYYSRRSRHFDRPCLLYMDLYEMVDKQHLLLTRTLSSSYYILLPI